MTIKELERASGLTRSSIRFYEKEGLLSPSRRENDYREYSEQDLHRLQIILLLRQLDVPVESIHGLFAGTTTLDAVLTHQRYVSEQNALLDQRKWEVCEELQRSYASVEEIAPEKYLEMISERVVEDAPAEERAVHPKRAAAAVALLLVFLALLFLQGARIREKEAQIEEIKRELVRAAAADITYAESFLADVQSCAGEKARICEVLDRYPKRAWTSYAEALSQFLEEEFRPWLLAYAMQPGEEDPDATQTISAVAEDLKEQARHLPVYAEEEEMRAYQEKFEEIRAKMTWPKP